MSDLALPMLGPVPPGLLLLLGAVPLAFLRGLPRKLVQVAAPVLALWQVLALRSAQLSGHELPHVGFSWMGMQLHLLHADEVRSLFAIIFALICVVGSIYALHVEDRLQNASALAYAGGALGVVYAGDLVTFVLFWELMALGSVMLVLARRTKRALSAGLRYIAVHALGGTLLLCGVVAWVQAGHDIAVTQLPQTAGLAGWLILLGVVINAAVPPLHAWLPDAYPEATVTGSVFLSAYTTKTAVFALVVLFAGWKVLLWAGVAMTLYGVLYAMLENDLRRLLAYHIISQVGYMVAAAGMGTTMALDGAGAHAYSHILYKALLFMGAGAVITATGREKLTELGGLSKPLRWVMILYAVGAMSIGGFPLFNGFVSKAIIVTAASQGGWPLAELLLVFASVGTFLSTGLKILWFAFLRPVEKPYAALQPVPANMYVAMGIAAFFCTLYGVWPKALYVLLPFRTDYHPYTLHHVVQSVQLLTLTALGFWFLLPKLKSAPAVSVDTDWLYRRPLPVAMLALSRGLYGFQSAAGRAMGRVVDAGQRFFRDPLALADRMLGRGMLPAPEGADRSWEDRHRLPLGPTVLVVLTVFGVMAVANLLARYWS